MAAKKESPFFERRRQRNVLNPPHHFRRDEFWHNLVGCLCTSVQRAGPNSRVAQLSGEKPFPLSLAVCESQRELHSYVETVLHNRGIRFGPKIGRYVESNMAWLRNGGWEMVEHQFRTLIGFSNETSAATRIAAERTAARTIMGRNGALVGFGPKQARNLWQWIGVTRYEIPLDSRITRWVNNLPSTFGMDAKQLYRSVTYYEAKMSQIQAICEAAEVYPCLFDAAVFSGADADEWTEDNGAY